MTDIFFSRNAYNRIKQNNSRQEKQPRHRKNLQYSNLSLGSCQKDDYSTQKLRELCVDMWHAKKGTIKGIDMILLFGHRLDFRLKGCGFVSHYL